MLNGEKATIRKVILVVALCAAASLLLFWPDVAEAQCAMCRTAVQSAGEQTQRTMRTAMLILLVPTVLIFCSIFAVFLKYGKRRDDDEGKD
jgi:heme/copper-type cytochrome/quinol oxidase subunit 2